MSYDTHSSGDHEDVPVRGWGREEQAIAKPRSINERLQSAEMNVRDHEERIGMLLQRLADLEDRVG